MTVPQVFGAPGQIVDADTVMSAKLAEAQHQLGEAFVAAPHASWVGDNMRAAHAEARVELDADELHEAKQIYEHNRAENAAAYAQYQTLVDVARSDHEKLREPPVFVARMEQYDSIQHKALGASHRRV